MAVERDGATYSQRWVVVVGDRVSSLELGGLRLPDLTYLASTHLWGFNPAAVLDVLVELLLWNTVVEYSSAAEHYGSPYMYKYIYAGGVVYSVGC